MYNVDIHLNSELNSSRVTTEIIDILNDYDFGDGSIRETFKVTDEKDDVEYSYYPLANKNYYSESINYNSNNKTFRYYLPKVIYEIEKIGIRAIKTTNSSYITHNSVHPYFFTYCNLATNQTKCCGFYNTNLNDGIEYMHLNQNLFIDLWFNLPFNQERYDIKTLSTYFNHFIIEFDIIRK